ncbi:MAG: pyruvate dehydrogenase (acetyl-transferring), homodimeric type, partial [Deltaproteobacteria bacterium]|nr:pyruvate dehydrogenase (acetyl-transferring), homodimeric type [Deltaproteobacteria bacterium]
VLAKTIKGYGLGESGEGRNISHQQKKLNEDELRQFRARFGIPISDDRVAEAPFYRPPDDSPEIQYLHERRAQLGGYLPSRVEHAPPLETPKLNTLVELLEGSRGRNVATTMAFTRILAKLIRDPTLGKLVVPIIPDEARTFGMDVLFREVGIYNPAGQRYEPVDKATLLFYREQENGQLLEEGITEAGAMASFIAAGTAHSTHGLQAIPFYMFYSMFGFQRVGDLIWAAADARARGFLLGCTAGRTTLNGEGLQHQDGHSHVLATSVPSVIAYDPGFAYEVAVIVQEGLRRMVEACEPIIFYITLYNEQYAMPEMPTGAEEGILRGMYRLRPLDVPGARARPQLFASGPLLRETLRAQEILAETFGVPSDAWSVTSYKELRRDALAAERWNRLHPTSEPRTCHLWQSITGNQGPFIATSDYMKFNAEQVARWIPGRFVPLGTDGFGRSDTRETLRRFFEVDAESIVLATLHALCEDGTYPRDQLPKAIEQLGLNPDGADPVRA